MVTADVILLGAVVLFAFTTEAAAGFGSMIISLTIAAHFMSVGELLVVLVPLNLVLVSYMVTRYHAHIAGRLLVGSVLPLMLLGLGAGQLIFYHLETAELRYGLGALVVAVAARELWVRSPTPRPLGSAERGAWILSAGVIHGIFATGGPPLVYALGRSGFDKHTFRSTLAMIWLVLDVALLVSFAVAGRLDAVTGGTAAALLPVVAVALYLGEHIHRRIDEQRFRIGIFALLLVAGVTLWL